MPDTDLHLDALTSQDLEDLDFVARNADVVNMSFVRRPDDVAALQDALDRLGAGDIGVVLKIENVAAFADLPSAATFDDNSGDDQTGKRHPPTSKRPAPHRADGVRHVSRHLSAMS